MDQPSRDFLLDFQAGLIEDGLESMRKRRKQLLKAAHRKVPQGESDDLLEEVGAALDALRVARVARDVFPDVSENHDAWEVARAILADEKKMKEIVIEGVRAHSQGDGAVYAVCLERTIKQIAKTPAPWKDKTQELWDLCGKVADKENVGDLYRVVALDDTRVNRVLNGKPKAATEYLRGLLRRIDLLNDLEAEERG